MRISGWAGVVCAALGVGGSVMGMAADAVQRPPITGLAYVRFYEADMPAAEHFYGGYLGLKPVANAGEGRSYAVGALQRVDLVPAAAGATPTRMQGLGLLTPDLPGMERYLTAHGKAVEKVGPNEIRVHDPEGNVVAFVRQGSVRKDAAAATGLLSGKAGSPTSSRMIHAGFQVHDKGSEDTFYLQLLGFKSYWYGGMKAGVLDWVALQVPEGTDWVEYMLEGGAHADARQLGVMDHISLGVDHIQDADKQLQANGLEDASKRKSQVGKDGKWQLNVFDPDLTRVEFMEFKPVQEPCCSPFTGKQPSQGDAE